jgi:hypothetical protein
VEGEMISHDRDELLLLSKEELVDRIMAWRETIIPLTHGPYGFQRGFIRVDPERLLKLGEM